MRSQSQLIDELEADAQAAKKLESGSKSWSMVGLVVGFEDHTEFIFDHFGDRNAKLTRLNELVRQHGTPVGKIAVVRTATEGTCYTRPIREFEGEPWVKKYLNSLCQRAVHTFSDPHQPTSVQQETGWLS